MALLTLPIRSDTESVLLHMMEPTKDLPLFKDANIGQLVGFQGTATWMEGPSLNIDPLYLSFKAGEDRIDSISLTRAWPHLDQKSVEIFDMVQNRRIDVPFSPFDNDIRWAESAPDEGYHMRDFYLFNGLLAFMDTVHQDCLCWEDFVKSSGLFTNIKNASAHERLQHIQNFKSLTGLFAHFTQELLPPEDALNCLSESLE